MKLLSFLVLMPILSLLYVRVCAMDDLRELSRRGASLEEQLRAAARIKNINFGQLNDAAKRGDAKAQLHLGLLCDSLCNVFGDPIGKQKEELAALWLGRSAEQGNQEAQYHYGDFHLLGRGGVPRDIHSARTWMIRAAKQGNMEATFEVACRYYKGWAYDGPNRSKAKKWFEMLLEQAGRAVTESETVEDREAALSRLSTARDFLQAIDEKEKATDCMIL